MDRSEGYKPRRAAGPDVCVPSRREAARREQAQRNTTKRGGVRNSRTAKAADEKTDWPKANGIFRGGLSSAASRSRRSVTPEARSRREQRKINPHLPVESTGNHVENFSFSTGFPLLPFFLHTPCGAPPLTAAGLCPLFPQKFSLRTTVTNLYPLLSWGERDRLEE